MVYSEATTQLVASICPVAQMGLQCVARLIDRASIRTHAGTTAFAMLRTAKKYIGKVALTRLGKTRDALNSASLLVCAAVHCFNALTVNQYTDRDDTKVTDCGGGRYCCGHRNETCCNAGDGYYIRAGSAVPALIQQPSTLASTPTTTGENTVTSVSSTNLSSTPTSQSTAFRSSPPARVEESASETPSGHAKKDDGMQLGLGLGVALPATLAAIATLVLAYIRFKNGKKTQKRRQDYNRLQPRTRTV